MKTDTDIILGYDQDEKLVFAKTFNHKTHHSDMMNTYEYARNNFASALICSIERLGENFIAEQPAPQGNLP